MRRLKKLLALGALFPAVASGYMLFESQWLRCREERLAVPGLPGILKGKKVLHLSDVHAGQPGLNVRTLRKAVEWASAQEPDMVVLTGDILGTGRSSDRSLELLAGLEAPLGKFAVAGNHEYGLSKNPFAHTPRVHHWEEAGIEILEDRCVRVRVEADRGGAGPGAEGAGEGIFAVCGADYLTGGYGLEGAVPADCDFAVLLVHRPPAEGDEPTGRFPLVFAGHTHGGQIRLPALKGMVALYREGVPYLSGVHSWRGGVVAVSVGIGTTFLPFRLFTRPEVTIYELVPDEGFEGVSGIHGGEDSH